MVIKNSIKFDLQQLKSEDKPIRMRVSYGGFPRLDFLVGFRVNNLQFDKKNECVINHKEAKRINNEIAEHRKQAEELFTRFEIIEKKIPEREEFKNLFLSATGKIKEEQPKCNAFSKVFDEFMFSEGAKNNWDEKTKGKFNTIKAHFIESNIDASLNNLSENEMIAFVRLMEKKDYKNTTIVKRISQFKQFIRWCRYKGYYKGQIDKIYNPKLKGSDGSLRPVIHLTWEELMSLYNHDFTNNKRLDQVRDVFCFCCFTSLRYSDVAKLKKSDIKKGYILVVTQKTADSLKIELNDYSQAILAKYKDSEFKNSIALPIISDVKMNEYLKEIGRILELNEPQRIVYFVGAKRHEEVYPKYELLTTHCGRRTFVVNALYLGIPAEVVMSWTGHSDYKAMKPYIKIVNELKASNMNKFNHKQEID